MSLLSVSKILSNQRFVQPFVLTRKTGAFIASSEGEYGTTSSTLNLTGIIQPATEKDKAEFLPEGQRQLISIKIFSKSQMFMDNGLGQQSDEIDWQGQRYRIAFSKPWQLHGYYMAIAIGYANG
jgi:hypothetical protein